MILEKIGAGGMGEVYLAEDPELRRKVAIKFLPAGYASDPDVLARFRREARAAAALNHPNIITIHEISSHEGQPFIVMAHVEGRPLSAVIAGDPLPIDRILDYALQIASGLGKAHQADVVHRDVKPDNILIDRDGHVKILDFGLAKLSGVTKLTEEASTLGTIYYMSPEQAQGAEIDHRSDIFSLGTVLYEMIAGRLPFQGDHPAAVTYSITSEDPQPLARFNNRVTPELERIVSKALSKDRDERYQSAADLVADLKRERRLSESSASQHVASASSAEEKSASGLSVPLDSSTETILPASPLRRSMRFVIPAGLVFLAVVLLLVFKPFTLQIRPDQTSVAAENALAIMYFINVTDRTDEARLGEIMTNLLITDLSESSGLKVLSSQRLYDILKLLGMEGMRNLDMATSSEVAERAGVKWMLLGNILQVEPTMVVTSQIVEVATGEVTSSQRASGTSGEDIFAVADRLAGEIRSDMDLTEAEPPQAGDTGSKVSTHSEEAYRYYLEGMEYENKYYRVEAAQSFLKALEYDSTFAMAYMHLAIPPAATSPAKKIEYAKKAMRFSENVTERERLFIEVAYGTATGEPVDEIIDRLKGLIGKYPDEKQAYVALAAYLIDDKSEPEEAVPYLELAIEIDPLYKLAYNHLAYAYNAMGDLDRSIWAINKYIEIAPDEANPYDTRGDLYARNGKVDEAIASYKAALERKSDYFWSVVKLGHMYRAKRDFAAAENQYRQGLRASRPISQSLARTMLANLLIYQGKLEESLEMLDRGIASDRIENFDGWPYKDKIVAKADIYAFRGDLETALSLAEKLPRREAGQDENWDDYYAMLLASSGDFEGAERAVAALEKAKEQGELVDENLYLGRGWLAFSAGRYDEAATWFEKANDVNHAIWNQGMAARSYLEAGRLSEAVEEFEEVLIRFDNSWATDALAAVTAHYYSGLAYERSGWKEKASARYREFLEIWKDADPGIELVEDAKRRLESLQQDRN